MKNRDWYSNITNFDKKGSLGRSSNRRIEDERQWANVNWEK